MSERKFKTTAAYISGAICGHMWMPASMAGKPYQGDLRGRFGLMPGLNDAKSFEDVIRGIILRDGGDFQDPLFTFDTVLRIERRCVDGPGKYRVHVREIPLIRLAPDWVHENAHVGDFMAGE